MARLSFNVDPADVRIASYKTTKLFSIVDEFIESGADIAEFLFAEKEYSNAQTCVNALNNSIKKRKITSVKAIKRKNRAFLVREEV